MTRILIADDHEVVRFGLRASLRASSKRMRAGRWSRKLAIANAGGNRP